MFEIFKNLKGDRAIWTFVGLLAGYSFLSVFSASSNLAYMNHGTGNTFSYLLKHGLHITAGFFILINIQKIPYQYYRSISRAAMPIVWILLACTLLFGEEKGSAKRWLEIPLVGISFQTSALASLVIMVFVARYLSKTFTTPMTFQKSFIDLWIPVGITLILILPNNFSTAALIFLMVIMLVFIGNYPAKYIAIVIALALSLFVCFIVIAKIYESVNPEHTPKVFKRVKTWENRWVNYRSDDKNKETSDDDYQIEKAKTAIASGGFYGLGPGKSVQKNFLPQSSSDFIFAIIVEEYGLIFGGLPVLFLYLLLFFRFVVAAHKANSMFGKLLVVGLGFPMIFQALINMGVAVQLLPVTGQTLPLISSGGSSIWMTCCAIGIILNVTKKEDEIVQEIKEKAKRDEVLQKLIDEQIAKENLPNPEKVAPLDYDDEEIGDYSIQDDSKNPMTAIEGIRVKK